MAETSTSAGNSSPAAAESSASDAASQKARRWTDANTQDTTLMAAISVIVAAVVKVRELGLQNALDSLDDPATTVAGLVTAAYAIIQFFRNR